MNLLSLIQVIFNNRLKYPPPRKTVTVMLVSTDTQQLDPVVVRCYSSKHNSTNLTHKLSLAFFFNDCRGSCMSSDKLPPVMSLKGLDVLWVMEAVGFETQSTGPALHFYNMFSCIVSQLSQ